MTRPAATTGGPSRPASRGQGKQYDPPAEIIRMPSGSIVQIPRFESLDAPYANLNRALMFALPLSIFLWTLLGLAVWGLISVFL